MTVATDSSPLQTYAVSKTYGRRFGHRTRALRDVDLAIPAGSITALVGPNGAGKSTLIRGFVGFERPTSGRMTVMGVDPWRDRGRAIKHVGYVPQNESLYRSLTVAQHLDMAASLRPRFDLAIARRRLDELEIPEDRRAGELSGGQQAQVGLALALGTRAEVLLLDEPLAALDPLARREFLGVLVDAVRADGSTALLSSHVITDIEAVCDRLVVLGGGRILLDDTLAAAVASHRIGAPDDRMTGGLVSEFPGPAGKVLALWRASEGGRPATLDEVVLGYLASGRRSRPGGPTAALELTSAAAADAAPATAPERPVR
jgi:ABC-2 type transport system ATP-binding protein